LEEEVFRDFGLQLGEKLMLEEDDHGLFRSKLEMHQLLLLMLC
jgi:hypothetical protein